MSKPEPSPETAAAPAWEAPWLSASDDSLAAMNAAHGWSLNREELRAVQAHFRAERREPTRAEVETVAQTWSEHCKHKTFRSPVRYQEGKTRRYYKDLLADTIQAATKKVRKPWCLSVFEDNAGVVQFDRKWALAYKVETHNHPCAIEPYGGAETGVGGVVRDILGVGLGAKPILNTDIFCFCPPDYAGELPEGAMHPRRTMMGVVAGVRDYGNRMGIPTASGAIWFDPAYRLNPLVFCGTIGLMPLSAVRKEVRPGDLIVAVGGRTGRDGIHGATFSSADLDGTQGASVVQIGHAIMEKRMLDALLQARERGLYRAVTDCGAGGFSSAVGEMAEGCGARGGARLRLENALLKTEGLDAWEIWLSESQERMVLAVPPKQLKELKSLLDAEDVESCVLGEFEDGGRLVVTHGAQALVDLDLRFLHKGLPVRERQAVWNPPKNGSSAPRKGGRREYRERIEEALRWMLAHPNVCSREWVIRQYDYEVQAGTVIKPLQGLHHDGPGDATVFWPMAITGEAASFRGFAVSHGLNPAYGKLDPYAMALACVDEALSNLACVGADVSRAALLDNFCWGSPESPEAMGELVRAAQGCHDAAVGFAAPFISGKDSFYNETIEAGRRHAIPPTLLISALAPVPDIRKAVTMDFKTPGNPIYLVGWTSDELGGSLFAEWSGRPEPRVPLVEIRSAKDALCAVAAAAQKELVLSAHNLSEGGLAVALSEMAFSGEVGAQLDLYEAAVTKEVDDEVTVVFSESPSRFLLEVPAAKEKAFLKEMKGVPMKRVGATIANPVLRLAGFDGSLVLETDLATLKSAWQRTLPAMLEGRR